MADNNKKIFLDQAGLERLVEYIKNELNQKANKGEGGSGGPLPDNLVYQEDLADYSTKDELEAVEAKATSAYHVKGSVADETALNAIQNPSIGDVYNLEDTGANAVWTGSEWDILGGLVDLTPYLPKEDVYPIPLEVVNSILYSGPRAIVSDKDSINAMLANDEPEVELTLNQDLVLNEPLSIPADKTVFLDLDGNKISGSGRLIECNGGEITLKNGEVESVGRPVVVFDGEFILDGAEVTSTQDCALNATGTNAKIIINSGKVNAQESGALVTSGAQLILNGGEIECTDNCPIQGNGLPGQGDINVVMNGGKLTAHIQSNGYIACAVYMPNSGTFTMNDGEIVSDGAGIVMRGGQVNLNGGSVIANGNSGVKGRVGDSRVVVGPYAVVYDVDSKYPAVNTLELNIANGMTLQGTDGDISIVPVNTTANINDNR